jgi:hypothetical protein
LGTLTYNGGTAADSVYVANTIMLLSTTLILGNGLNTATVTNFVSTGDLGRDLYGNLTITGGTGIDDISVGLYLPVNETMPLDGDIDGDGIPDGGLAFVNGDITISTSAGIDTVFVGLFDCLNLTLDTGGASDEIDIYNGTVLELADIEASTTILNQQGLDNDIVRIAYLTVGSILTINTGVGSDLVSFITSSVFLTTDINTGAGNDTVAMLIHNLGSLNIQTSTGSDTVNLDNLLGFGAFTIDTSDGIDRFNMVGCTMSSLTLSLGNADDEATIINSIMTSLLGSLGEGDYDKLIISQSVIESVLTVDGGAGRYDTLIRYNCKLPTRQTVFSVEFAS